MRGGSIAGYTITYDVEGRLAEHIGFAGAIRHLREIAGVPDLGVDKVPQ